MQSLRARLIIGGGATGLLIAVVSGVLLRASAPSAEGIPLVTLPGPIVAFFIGAVAGWIGSRVSEVAQEDLRSRVRALTGGKAISISDDSIGDLASDIEDMRRSFADSVDRMESCRKVIHSVMTALDERARSMTSMVHEEGEMVLEAREAIEQINDGFRQVSNGVESLSAASEETSSSILEMVSSLEEVNRHTDALYTAAEGSSSATHQMAGSIREVDRNVGYLQDFVTETSTSMVEMNASIGEVQQNAAKSHDLAVATSESAEKGMRSVRETIDGMEQIRRAVLESNSVVGRLGERSAEIGKILTVIEDIAEQTNLLALNASILAVQAGEYGKGFSVVAGEIRDLSERTANSTKEIGVLVRAVQEEVSNAQKTMSRGATLVESGVALSHDAGEALNLILSSATSSAEMVKGIASATAEQARGSETVSRSIDRVSEMVEQINSATRQQAEGSSQIMESIESMKDLTSHVRQATFEQKSGAEMISSAVESILMQTNSLHRVANKHRERSSAIVGTTDRLRGASDRADNWADEMTESVSQLASAVRSLEEEIERLRV